MQALAAERISRGVLHYVPNSGVLQLSICRQIVPRRNYNHSQKNQVRLTETGNRESQLLSAAAPSLKKR